MKTCLDEVNKYFNNKHNITINCKSDNYVFNCYIQRRYKNRNGWWSLKSATYNYFVVDDGYYYEIRTQLDEKYKKTKYKIKTKEHIILIFIFNYNGVPSYFHYDHAGLYDVLYDALWFKYEALIRCYCAKYKR